VGCGVWWGRDLFINCSQLIVVFVSTIKYFYFMEDINLEELNKLREETETIFKKIGKVFCPMLKDDVQFTSDGFHHLRYDGSRSERSKREQQIKLRFFKTAFRIIKATTTLQEYIKFPIKYGKPGKDGFSKTKIAEYYSFIALTETKKYRVRTIVRRVGDGPFHFWSVMPYWGETKFSDGVTIQSVGSRENIDE
jgi:hypothetical protein